MFQDPNQTINGLGNATILDFWRWAYSDILNNRNRSIFAEFIVGNALDILHHPREEWAPYDFEYNGLKIEVKSAAFVQSWEQENPSKISFDVSKKQEIDEDGYYTGVTIRPADLYIFSLFSETNMESANVLDINAWQFYIVPTHFIDEKFGDQKTVTLNRLKAIRTPVNYGDIKNVVDVFCKIIPRPLI